MRSPADDLNKTRGRERRQTSETFPANITTVAFLSRNPVMLKACRPWQHRHAKSNHKSCFATKQLSAPGGLS